MMIPLCSIFLEMEYNLAEGQGLEEGVGVKMRNRTWPWFHIQYVSMGGEQMALVKYNTFLHPLHISTCVLQM